MDLLHEQLSYFCCVSTCPVSEPALVSPICGYVLIWLTSNFLCLPHVWTRPCTNPSWSISETSAQRRFSAVHCQGMAFGAEKNLIFLKKGRRPPGSRPLSPMPTKPTTYSVVLFVSMWWNPRILESRFFSTPLLLVFGAEKSGSSLGGTGAPMEWTSFSPSVVSFCTLRLKKG